MRPEFQKTKAGSTPRYMLGTACIVAFASALLTSERAAAQDAVRPSIAGAEVSAARAQPVFIPENYNLKIGQVQLKLGGSVTAEYNDNINLVRKGQLSDFIISPALTLDAALPITKLNTFHLTLGVGFSKYLEHSAYDTQAITVTPNSQLSYDIYIGGSVRLTLKDQFSLTQDPTTQASLNNVVNFQIFQNDVGATAVWDLNKLILTLGYSHLTEISLTSAFSYLNNNAEVLQSSVAVPLTEAIQVGLDVDGSYTQYEQNVNRAGRTTMRGRLWK